MSFFYMCRVAGHRGCFLRLQWLSLLTPSKPSVLPPIAIAAASDTIRPVAAKIRIHQVRASTLKTMFGFKILHRRSFVEQDQTFRQGYTLKNVETGTHN